MASSLAPSTGDCGPPTPRVDTEDLKIESATTAAQSSSPSEHDYFPNPNNVQDPSALETSQFWAENTSIHGMYYMLERGHFQAWKTIAWTIIVLTAAGGLVWALVAEVRDFQQFNVDTTTVTVIPTSMAFPMITLCNANKGVDRARQNATGIDEPKNETELVAISKPLHEFILYSEFNDREYTTRAELEEIWKPIITPLGLCFRFVTDERVIAPSTSGGLAVRTWLSQASSGTKWTGVRVFVTPKEEKLYNSSNEAIATGGEISHQTPGAVIVPPGSVSFLAMNLREFQREVDRPWSKCVQTKKSIAQCRMECIMQSAVNKCGCRIRGDPTSTFLDYCTDTNDNCTKTIDWGLQYCQICSIPPCYEQVFSTRYSSGRISNNVVKYVQSMQAIQHINEEEPVTDEELEDNVVALQINYDSIRYESTTESKSTTVSTMISNLGGSFGFFMGISMISVVELFVELILLRLVLPKLIWGKTLLYGIGQKKFD